MRFKVILVTACLLAVLFSGPVAQADFEYGRYSIFPTWGSANAVAKADINGDGRMDVILAVQYAPLNDPGILVFQQNELGQLGQPLRYFSKAPYGPAIGPRSVAVGDLNHDGKPDVVVGNGGFIEVFTQTQGGLLDSSTTVYTSSDSFQVVVADFNNDGRDDVAGIGFSGVDVFLQNATGSLDPPVTYSVSDIDMTAMTLAVGDVNNDGLKDVVLPNYYWDEGYKRYMIGVMLQTKDGTLQGPVQYSLGISQATSVVLTVGDVNGDGLNDVVAIASYFDYGMYSKLYVFLQNKQGNLELAPSLTYNLAYNVWLASVALADVNKDGRNDIIIASESTVWVIFQDSSGKFLDPQTYSSPYADIQNAQALAVDDLDGDGLLDIAVANYNYGLVLYYQRPIAPAIYSDRLPVDFGSVTVGTTVPQTVTFTNYGRSNLNVGQVSVSANDGQFYIQNDLCSRKSIPPYSQCAVTVAFLPYAKDYKKAYLNIPSDDPQRGDLQIPLFGNVPRKDLFYPWGAWNTGSYPEAVAIGDLNGDGKDDVAMTTSWLTGSGDDFRLFVFSQDKTGNLLAPAKYPISSTGYRSRTVDLGDLNNDGRADAVVANGAAGFEVFAQDGSGGLTSPVVYPGHLTSTVKVADFNNDGLLDVAECESSDANDYSVMPEMRLFLQNAKSSLDLSAEHYIPYFSTSMAAGDVNGDGLIDAVLAGRQGACPNISVFTQTTDGTLADPRHNCSEYGTPYGVAVGDVNGDNLQDVVFTYVYASKIGILLQKPDGTLAPEISYDCYPSPEGVRIVDLNNDGKNDIVILHGNQVDFSGTYVGFLLQDADGALIPEEVYDVGYATTYNSEGLGVGDFNGDGLPDIAIANYNYGLIFLYQKGSGPTPVSPRLTVTLQGTGQGEVTDGTGTLKCATGSCTKSYRAGTVVRLYAAAGTGSVFGNWNVEGCENQDWCDVVLNGNASITATFNATPYTLGVTVTGDGTVKATGLTCSGVTCSGTYYYNTQVSMTATPAAQGSSVSWTGCNSAKGSLCSVTMSSNKSVTVSFTPSAPNPCTYAISSTGRSFTKSGGNVTVKVIATGADTCADPLVSSSEAWITATLKPLKNNKGSVKISVPENTTILAREGTVDIGGSLFDITQRGVPCVLNGLTPPGTTLTALAQSSLFSVNAVSGCGWTAELLSGDLWLSLVSEGAGSGNGTISYAVSENTTKKPRSGKIKVYLNATPNKSRTFTVTQKR